MDIQFAQITMLETREIVNNTGQIPDVPANPRTIRKENFEKLKCRIEQRNLLGVFPIKVFLNNGKYIVMGGNQRFRAAKALKMEEIPCVIIPEDADAETLREIIILENTHDGVNDWDALANEWDAQELTEWGLDETKWGLEPTEGKKNNGNKNQPQERRIVAVLTFEREEDRERFRMTQHDIEREFNCKVSDK